MFTKTLTTAALASFALQASAAPSYLRARNDSSPVVPTEKDLGSSGLAVWWGQTPYTVDLEQICASSNIDIVMLSFLNHFWSPKSLWPSLNFGSYTGQPSPAQKKAGATGLFDGSAMASKISQCQSAGKRIYISLGGDSRLSSTYFNNDAEATAFADNLWYLLLGGVGNSTTDPIRPFGTDVVLDGVDLDTEGGKPDSYGAFVGKLRENMKSDTKRSYHIGAAPQCHGHSILSDGGDGSLPDEILTQLDDVWVQFYNNEECKHNGAMDDGFAKSVKMWSDVLGDNTKLWIGTPVNETGAGIGSLPIDKVADEVSSVKGMKLPNLGGYALWDGTLALGVKDGSGKSYDQVVKEALN